MSSIVALLIGSTFSMCWMSVTTLLFRYSGILKIPDLIFRNSVGMCSSSNGRVPHSSAYRMTPQLRRERKKVALVSIDKEISMRAWEHSMRTQ